MRAAYDETYRTACAALRVCHIIFGARDVA
jgi:hypothetical protein